MAEAANDFPDKPNGEMAIWMLCFRSSTVEHWSQSVESNFADGVGVGQRNKILSPFYVTVCAWLL